MSCTLMHSCSSQAVSSSPKSVVLDHGPWIILRRESSWLGDTCLLDIVRAFGLGFRPLLILRHVLARAGHVQT